MKQDKRKNWTYRCCKIVPVDCYPLSHGVGKSSRGQVATPDAFEDGIYRTRYWRIEYRNGHWRNTATKKTAREFIDRQPEYDGKLGYPITRH